jgi:16S rRNA (adenine1518-N6/adenine1519-N6)-dimethyltransferase
MNELLNKTILLIKDFKLENLDASDQNFLIDESIIKRELEAAELKPEDVVLDIGAGFGYVMEEIRKTCKVIGIEKDIKIFSYLINKFELDKNVKLINGDAVKIIYPEFNKVVSNPPYTIVDRILDKLRKYDFDSGVMILPKTISDSIISPEESEQTRFSITLKSFFSFREVMEVPQDAFYPSPRVVSKMVSFKRVPYNMIQGILNREEMTVKNSILRAHQELENKTKRQSAEFFTSLDIGKIRFKDTEIKKLKREELLELLSFIKINYTT